MHTPPVSRATIAQQATSTLLWSAVGLLTFLALLFAIWYFWYVFSPNSQRNLGLLAATLPSALVDPKADERVEVTADKEETGAFINATRTEAFRAVLLDDAYGTVMYALCGSKGSKYVASGIVNNQDKLVVHEIQRIPGKFHGAACDQKSPDQP